MKKWMYLIFPGAMLAIFLVFYVSSEKRWAEQEQQAKEKAAAEQAASDKQKSEAEHIAREAAAKRAAQQKADELAKEQARQAKWDKESADIQKATDDYKAGAARYNKEVSRLEIEIDSLHRKKEADNRDDFDQLKAVELARVKQQAAELDIQRMVQMIATRAEQSSMTQMPPPAPTEK